MDRPTPAPVLHLFDQAFCRQAAPRPAQGTENLSVGLVGNRGRRPRFENLLASHLLKWTRFTQDWGLPPLELHYLRDREKREVDFLLTLNRKPWALLEAKLSLEKPSPALTYFAERLHAPYKIQVVLNLDRPGLSGNVHVIDAANFLRALPV